MVASQFFGDLGPSKTNAVEDGLPNPMGRIRFSRLKMSAEIQRRESGMNIEVDTRR